MKASMPRPITGGPALRTSTAVKHTTPREPELRRILDLSVPVTVILADRAMPVEDILKLTVGTIIEFEVPFDSELVLQAADRPIGRGQAVKVGENFGLRITHVGPVRDRIDALRGG